MKHAVLLIGLILTLGACKPVDQGMDIEIRSSNPELDAIFKWAKTKARSYVQTGKTGPVNISERDTINETEVAYQASYWAGYPLRTAFYSRDFCHQAIGAHLLGLQEENFQMLKAFAASADAAKKWYPLWAINFDGSPYVLDYRNDTNFVREVPAVFELLEQAANLYRWTGEDRYWQDSVLWNFYQHAMTDFIDLHDTRMPNGIAEGSGTGSIFQGTATYNEQRDTVLLEAGDGLAAQYRAYTAFAELAQARGELGLAAEYREKAAELYLYFNQDWGIQNTLSYNRGYATNLQPVQGWGKENSWFLAMKGILDPESPRTENYLDFIQERLESKDDIPDNIEALSYIPEVFFQYHQDERAWQWIQHIISRIDQEHVQAKLSGKNGNYPEVSYVLVSNLVRDMMGIQPNAKTGMLRTLSHLPKGLDYLKTEDIPIGTARFSIEHQGKTSTTIHYRSGAQTFKWRAQFEGVLEALFVNGEQQKAEPLLIFGKKITSIELSLEPGATITVATK